ncbi:MAG: isopenicillin N synthase family oxygenase [Alphaproteobacteria bacterium]|jgi:isopenicillin N synthase-like dioxygenase|nr:isopenicillin N synthase family oxygenase [Alphaproteobacteria bacterium]
MSRAADSESKVSDYIAQCLADEQIPVIDIGSYMSGAPEAVAQFATDLRAIQEGLGFYCIVNHGVEQSVIDNAFDQIAELFALPDEEKMNHKVDFHHQGFIPNKAMILRWSKIAKNEKKDLNEAWAFMRERKADDPKVLSNTRHRGLNQWPEALPEFRKTLLEYQETMAALAIRMLPAYALALDLPADYFAEKFSTPEYYNRCAWYPPVEVEEGQFSLSPHSDHSSMTYLPLMDVPGLQVMSPTGKWIEVEPVRGAIVVNTGEFFNRWTNGRFIATPHRVVPPVKDRYALTFFFNCNDETVAEPFPSCIAPGEVPKYEPMSFHEFFVTYMDGNYIYRTAEMDED